MKGVKKISDRIIQSEVQISLPPQDSVDVVMNMWINLHYYCYPHISLNCSWCSVLLINHLWIWHQQLDDPLVCFFEAKWVGLNPEWQEAWKPLCGNRPFFGLVRAHVSLPWHALLKWFSTNTRWGPSAFTGSLHPPPPTGNPDLCSLMSLFKAPAGRGHLSALTLFTCLIYRDCVCVCVC